MARPNEQQHYYHPIHEIYKNHPPVPESLYIEEAFKERRSWDENMKFYTGSGYATGALVGGAKGVLEGLGAAERGDSLKLRVNRMLNSGGDVGRKFGNKLGVLGIFYAVSESLVVNYREENDTLSSVLAGLGAGAVYRAATGLRGAALGGVLGAVAAGAAVVGKQVVKRYVNIPA